MAGPGPSIGLIRPCSNDQVIELYVDSKSAMELAKNPIHHQRSKHIDIKYHYIRNELENGSVVLTYVPTDVNLADMFTKPVTKVKLAAFHNKLFGL